MEQDPSSKISRYLGGREDSNHTKPPARFGGMELHAKIQRDHL